MTFFHRRNLCNLWVMPLRRTLREIANSLLGRWDLEIIRRSTDRPDPLTMDSALDRVKSHGWGVQTIVDIGASDGKWSRAAMKVFPDSHYLLIEPLEERRADLERMKSQSPKLDYAILAAGESSGEVDLTVGPDLDSSGVYDGANAGARRVTAGTIDGEIQKRNLPPPYLLKFDTHGYELPILSGCRHTLRETRLIVMEVYNFQISTRSRRFHEMCTHLETLGFRCIDLADPLLRPRDGALWQMDLFFIPVTSEVFADARYR